jgi:type II secretory pathway pseudopilin PulG
MTDDSAAPPRNPFAYLFALFVPFGGRLGGGFSFLVLIYIIGIMAAIAIPAYQDYTVKAKLSVVVDESRPARDKLAAYYLSSHRVPGSLEEAGVAAQLADGSPLSLNPRNMALSVATTWGELILVPSADHGRIVWNCTNGERLRKAQLPPSCQSPAAR